MDDYSVILVESTNQAMRVEHLLNMAEIPTKLIPVPRYLSSNCGNCVRIISTDKEKASGIIEKNQIQTQGIVELEK
jgi:hypothetical protein